MLNKTDIFYKRCTSNTSFAITEYYFDIKQKAHFLSISEGMVGEKSLHDCIISDNYQEITTEYERIKSIYNNKKPDTEYIKITIGICKNNLCVANGEMDVFLKSIINRVCFVLKTTGQDICSNYDFQYNYDKVKKRFEMKLEVIDNRTFYNQLFITLSTLGVKMSDILMEVL
jgi:hypothetical protein